MPSGNTCKPSSSPQCKLSLTDTQKFKKHWNHLFYINFSEKLREKIIIWYKKTKWVGSVSGGSQWSQVWIGLHALHGNKPTHAIFLQQMIGVKSQIIRANILQRVTSIVTPRIWVTMCPCSSFFGHKKKSQAVINDR